MARANLTIPAGLVPLNAKPEDVIYLPVASAYGTALYPGDPVIAINDGTVARAAAGAGAAVTTDGITGVITEIIQYKDAAGFLRKNAKYLPASTTWTAQGDRSLVAILPSYLPVRYRVRCDAASTMATIRAATFAGAEVAFGTADTGLGLSGAVLSVSSIGTGSKQLRIVELVDVAQNDPTVTGFMVDVLINLPFAWPIMGQSATTI